MNKQQNSKRTFTVLFTLLFTLSFVLAGCSSVGETAASGSAATHVSVQTTEGEEPTTTTAAADTEGISYVSIDINPSIELTVKYGVVLDATAYNDDGAEIILSTDVLGMTPNEATATLIGAFAMEGYITPEGTDGAIVITVYGDEEDVLLANLQTTAADKLTTLGITCDVVASAVEPEIAQTAKAAGITPGRYLLIKYLAERDGITIEQARDLYGSMKMKDLLKMIPDASDVFGENAYIYLSSVIQGLTPEQLQILTQAKLAYQTAMKTAVQAYNQTKEEARQYFQSARDAAHDAFKQTHDQQAWKQAKSAAKQEMDQRYKAAKQAFTAARTQAQEAFMTAIAGLGLTEEQIDAILEWDFDFEWDFDYDWDEDQDIDADDQNDEGGQDDQNDEGGQDDQDDDDDQNDNDDQNDDGEGENNNGGNGNGNGHN